MPSARLVHEQPAPAGEVAEPAPAATSLPVPAPEPAPAAIAAPIVQPRSPGVPAARREVEQTGEDRPPREAHAGRHSGAPERVPAERRSAAHAADGDENGPERGATGPQLRRFIKSRAYVPMHELRRRFAINGHDDEVTAVDLAHCRVFVGLPDREGRLLGELLRGGDIGYELSLDPVTPIVVGLYPMRPVTRP